MPRNKKAAVINSTPNEPDRSSNNAATVLFSRLTSGKTTWVADTCVHGTSVCVLSEAHSNIFLPAVENKVGQSCILKGGELEELRLCSRIFYLFQTWPSLSFPIIGPAVSILHCTSLDGFRRTSPTPPPLLRPWLNTVTMHMSRESHVRSLSSITTADGWMAREAMETQKYCHDHCLYRLNAKVCLLCKMQCYQQSTRPLTLIP